ncbi:MAG TPA: hypothetical protein VHK88_20180 [Aquihabitans sp.]|jgi:hypothetical protein|nr:hypothetical protein [Aquihabitans sp.]
MASAEVEAVRDWVGTEPSTTTIEAFLDRFATKSTPTAWAALSILRRRRRDVAVGPESWAVDGDYRETRNLTATLAALDLDIARLERITGDTTGTAKVLDSAPICATGGER